MVERPVTLDESVINQRVVLTGLAKSEMNGREGIVNAIDDDRLIVILEKTPYELKQEDKKKGKKSKKGKKVWCSPPL